MRATNFLTDYRLQNMCKNAKSIFVGCNSIWVVKISLGNGYFFFFCVKSAIFFFVVDIDKLVTLFFFL